MQPQGLTDSIDATRRDSRLLRMAFRRARQSGDYRGALAASQLGDQMGLQVGAPVHDEAIRGVGMRRFSNNMRMSQPMGGGMNGMEDGGGQVQQSLPGVGGYDFNQRVGSPLARQQQQPSTLDLQRAVARRKWQMAGTTAEKDAITEESAAKGLTTNPSAVQDALMRRRGNFGVPQLAEMGGSQAQSAAETVPWRPNSQIARFDTSGMPKSLDARDVLYSKNPDKVDTGFGVPSLRRFDMRGGGVRQNPEFSPAADKAFADQQATEKAASDAEIRKQHYANMENVRRLESERKALIGKHQDDMLFGEIMQRSEPAIIGQSDTGNQLSYSIGKFGDFRPTDPLSNYNRRERFRKEIKSRTLGQSAADAVKQIPTDLQEAGQRLSGWVRRKTGGRVTF